MDIDRLAPNLNHDRIFELGIHVVCHITMTGFVLVQMKTLDDGVSVKLRTSER